MTTVPFGRVVFSNPTVTSSARAVPATKPDANMPIKIGTEAAFRMGERYYPPMARVSSGVVDGVWSVRPQGTKPRPDLLTHWSLTRRIKNFVLWSAARAVLAVTSHLSPSQLRALGRGVGFAAHAFGAKWRATARGNIAIAFPDLDEAKCRDLARRSFV